MLGRPLTSAGVPMAQHKRRCQQAQREQREQRLPWPAASLASYIGDCLRGLGTLFRECQALAKSGVADMALILFSQSYLALPAAGREALVRDEPLSRATLAAALTVAIKFGAHRSVAPSASAMRRITGARAGCVHACSAASQRAEHAGQLAARRSLAGAACPAVPHPPALTP